MGSDKKLDGSVTSTGWGGEDKSGLVNEIVAPGRCKAKGKGMQVPERKREGGGQDVHSALLLLRYSPRLLAIGEKLRYSIG